MWQLVSDPEAYLHFMAGMTRWEVLTAFDRGLGARYQTLMRVRSAEVGGVIEVVEWVEASDLAWTSVTGIDQRGRWRLRSHADAGGGRPQTSVELRLSYGVAGSGLSGWLAEQVAAPTVRGHLRQTLEQLKRHVEHEQLRAAAAARRDARAGA